MNHSFHHHQQQQEQQNSYYQHHHHQRLYHSSSNATGGGGAIDDEEYVVDDYDDDDNNGDDQIQENEISSSFSGVVDRRKSSSNVSTPQTVSPSAALAALAMTSGGVGVGGDKEPLGSKTSSSSQNNSKSVNATNNSGSTFPFGSCKVCQDTATGIHYGVPTCEGCKGFFKRSILKKEFYKCFAGDTCVPNPKNRNKCKSCRFKKCIEVGMSFNGIKMGRIPKAEKEKAMRRLEEGGATTTSNTTPPNHSSSTDWDGVNDEFGLRRMALDSNSDSTDDGSAINDSQQSSTNLETTTTRRPSSLLDQSEMINLPPEIMNKFFRYNNYLKKSRTSATTSSSANSGDDMFRQLVSKRKYSEASVDEEIVPDSNQDYLTRFFNLIQENKKSFSSSSSSTTSLLSTSSSPSTATASVTNGGSANKKRPLIFNNRRINSKNKSSEILVKNIMGNQNAIKASSLLPNTFLSNLFTTAFLPCEPAYLVIFSLLNDKIYQIFVENTLKTYKMYERVMTELQNPERLNMQLQRSNKINPNVFAQKFLATMPDALQQAIKFVKELPGLNELNSTDFALIINKKLFDYFIIINSILFVNGESYLYLDEDTLYTRFWMNSIRPRPVVDLLFEFVELFNSLQLTKKEKGLLIALVFTMSSDIEVQDVETLRDLNEYYTRAILYEFDLNNRSYDFLIKLKKALAIMMQCRKDHSYD